MKIPLIKTITALCVTTLLWGCAAAPPAKKEPDRYVFFPKMPDPPRIQFLTSITSASDFISSAQRSSFADFVVGKKKKLPRKISKPYGVAIKGGVIYLCDTDINMLTTLDLPGQKFSFIGSQETQGVELKKPINIAIDADGTKYITDAQLAAVVVLDQNNLFKAMLGKKEMKRPSGIAVTADKLYVTDVLGNEILVYDKATGRLMKRIGSSTDGKLKILAPTNIAVDPQGNLYVSETMGYRVQKLSPDGNILKTFGGGLGDAFGQFARPRGIALDRKGLVYTVDAWHNVVQIFDPEGQLLLFFGEMGPNPGNLNLPAQIAIDYDNVELFKKYAAPDFEVEYLVIVTSQYGNRLVNVYGFGHKKGAGNA